MIKDLFSPCGENSGCDGCSILSHNKPFHAYLDDPEEADILFISRSFSVHMGNPVAFSKDEFKLMNKYLSNFPELRIEYSPSIKCPFVKEADLTTKDRKICKKYLEATVAQVKPSLIFSTGNLAMKMLIGKSGITAKRGTCFMYGDIPVIPLLDPYSVIMNPSNEQLFERDINNGINKYIYKKVDRSQFSYTIIDNSCI